MKKKRIEQNEIKRYFLIIAAFLSFMILSLLFFLSWLQQDVEVSSRKNCGNKCREAELSFEVSAGYSV